MLILFVLADDQRNGVSLDAGWLLESKMLDNVLLEIFGDCELLVVPGLALVDEGTSRIARVLVLDQFHFFDTLVFVLLQVEVFV
jgi:hypothetical protein